MLNQKGWTTCIAVFLITSAVLFALKSLFPQNHGIFAYANLFWTIPVLWASYNQGLKGGILVALFGIGLTLLFRMAHSWPQDPAWWKDVPYWALFLGTALFLGFMVEQDKKFIGPAKRAASVRDPSEINSQLDTLTHVYHRRYMERSLWSFWEAARNGDKTFSLLLLDLNQFRQINSRYGILVGDRVLRSMVATIMNSIRHGDVVGRFGSDQFLVILPQCNEAAAEGLIRRLQGEMAKLTFSDPLKPFKADFSAGFVHYSPEFTDLPAMLRRLSESLHRAKTEYRNGVRAG